MKRPRLAVRIGALVSSVALVTLYVSCKSTTTPTPDGKTGAGATPAEPGLFDRKQTSTAAPAPQTVLPGSKSGAVSFERPAQPAPKQIGPR